MSDEIKLLVRGNAYGGWKSARVTRGIETAAGSFSLTVSERWTNQQRPWPIGEGDECSIVIGDETVITGYVDEHAPAFDATNHTVTITGRDRAADLVDCSSSLTATQFKSLDLRTLAEKLCQPFGISVSVQAGLDLKLVPKKNKTAFNPGELSWNVLEQACRASGVLAVSNGRGGLTLTRGGTARVGVSLVQGENILSASAKYNVASRFYEYEVRGQQPGSDETNGVASASVKGSATDPAIRTARRLVVRAEHAVTRDLANARAAWEARVRAARGDAFEVVVQGWRQGASKPLWPVNALVLARVPVCRVDGEMLITQATYSVDDKSGRTTTLSLKRPDAFLPEPSVSTGAGNRWWKELVPGV